MGLTLSEVLGRACNGGECRAAAKAEAGMVEQCENESRDSARLARLAAA